MSGRFENHISVRGNRFAVESRSEKQLMKKGSVGKTPEVTQVEAVDCENIIKEANARC